MTGTTEALIAKYKSWGLPAMQEVVAALEAQAKELAVLRRDAKTAWSLYRTEQAEQNRQSAIADELAAALHSLTDELEEVEKERDAYALKDERNER